MTEAKQVERYDGMYNNLGAPDKKVGMWSVFTEETTRSFRIEFLCPRCKMSRKFRVSAEDVLYKKMKAWRIVSLEIGRPRKQSTDAPFRVEHCLEGFKPRKSEPQSGNFIFLIKRWFDKDELTVAELPREITK